MKLNIAQIRNDAVKAVEDQGVKVLHCNVRVKKNSDGDISIAIEMDIPEVTDIEIGKI